MMATGLWQDSVYSACCFMGPGARPSACATTLMRLQVGPISSAITLMQPTSGSLTPGWAACFPLQGGSRVHRLAGFWYCSLRFLVGRSHGAGKAPRSPFPLCGNRRQAGTLASYRPPSPPGMGNGTYSCFFRPTHPDEQARTPQRKRVVDVIREDKTLPPGVGRGHHSHRLLVGKWSSPFVPGHNCDPSSWLPLYVEHVMQGDLPELTGCVLACDCEMDMVCEGDALAGLVFEFGRPPPRAKEAAGWCIRAGAPGVGRSGRAPPYSGRSHPVLVARGSGGCVLLALSSTLLRELLLFYGGNQPPFTCFTQWLRSRGLRWDGPLVPIEAAGSHCRRGLADGAADGSGFAVRSWTLCGSCGRGPSGPCCVGAG